MTKAYKGYEDLLDDFQGGIMPYEAFGAERGMRQYGKELAAQAGMTRQLKDAEPEGAVSSFRSPGRRSPYLHGKDVGRFAKRRGKLAGMRARVSGEALGEEQLNKRRYLYEQMQDEIAAMRAEQQAKKKKQQQVIKAIGQVSAMGIGMMTQAGSIAKKYDALSPVNDVVETEVDESAEADDAVAEALDTDADAIESIRARQDEVVQKEELERSERARVLGGAEEALTELGAIEASERVFSRDLVPHTGAESFQMEGARAGASSDLELFKGAFAGNEVAAHELKRRYLMQELSPSLLRMDMFRKYAEQIGLPKYGGAFDALPGAYEEALGQAR